MFSSRVIRAFLELTIQDTRMITIITTTKMPIPIPALFRILIAVLLSLKTSRRSAAAKTASAEPAEAPSAASSKAAEASAAAAPSHSPKEEERPQKPAAEDEDDHEYGQRDYPALCERSCVHGYLPMIPLGLASSKRMKTT